MGQSMPGRFLSLRVKRLRRVWPAVRIIFRGDSGFCRWRVLAWCEHQGVGYIVGIAKNKRLNRIIEEALTQAEQEVAELDHKVRRFVEFDYKAASWDHHRRVMAKIEVTDKCRNPRYVLTNLTGDPETLYDKL